MNARAAAPAAPKHSPGPWRASPYSSVVGIAISAPGKALLAGVPGDKETAEANARFIVAAPDMAEALQTAFEALDLARMSCGCTVAERASGHHVDCYVPAVKAAIDATQAALEKAGL